MKYKRVNNIYQLVEPHVFPSKIKGYNADTIWYKIEPDGTITGKTLYGWDGASGPTIDDPDISVAERDKRRSRTAVPSLRHDIKYQMMRDGVIPLSCKSIADDEFHDDLDERGFDRRRTDIWHLGVKYGGASSCIPGTKQEILEAP